MRRGTWLIGGAFALAFAAPAQAAPVDLGVGSDPSAVIDPAGTAHIVYDSAGGQTYCRLPRNAKACDILTPLPVEFHAGRVKIFRRAADGALLIVQAVGADIEGARTASPGCGRRSTAARPGRARCRSAPACRGSTTSRSRIDGAVGVHRQRGHRQPALPGRPADRLRGRMLDLNAKPDGSHAGSAYRAEIVQTPQGRWWPRSTPITDTLWRIVRRRRSVQPGRLAAVPARARSAARAIPTWRPARAART